MTDTPSLPFEIYIGVVCLCAHVILYLKPYPSTYFCFVLYIYLYPIYIVHITVLIQGETKVMLWYHCFILPSWSLILFIFTSILSVHKIWKKINFILQFNARQSVLFVKTVWGLCANNQAYQVFGKMFKVSSCTEYIVYRWCTLCYGCLLSARLRIQCIWVFSVR